ncbi:uncharacterized protein LOC103317821 [Nasonia vitripennis]|uniref:DNA-directed DNA polymerase n=1 Tax=Nasonia vitripennis TaxID=7425 RepID=A0A7M7ITE0_NASVI|nr:uncharacterized protein LOC103317821 [Nasonia vitripennis]XP_016836676.1 uncharacterized protein LOC103317821 [Nasonia vitripennis]
MEEIHYDLINLKRQPQYITWHDVACTYTMAIKFSSNNSGKGLEEQLLDIFDTFIKADHAATDSMKISASSDVTTLESVSEFFKPVSEYTYNEFIDFISTIRKKYPNFFLMDGIKISVTCIFGREIEKPDIVEVARKMIYSCDVCGTKIVYPSSYESHLCYMPTVDDKKSNCYVFYDFLSMQESVNKLGEKNYRTHKVNVCVAHQVCDECNKLRISDIPKICESCHGGDLQIFKNHAIEAFIDFLLKIKLSNNMNTITCIAHKSQEFHAQFIFKHLIDKGCFPKFIAFNDTKIMYIELSKGHQIRFIDSFNYINHNLSDFPKTFGFQDVIKKWRFPHLFNSSENQNYHGAIPDVRFYSPEIMSNKKRDKFIAWHTRLYRTNYRFDFQEEIVEYCKNNVEILRRGCYEFRQKFIELTTVDPFIGKGIITIAGACHEFYRKKILQHCLNVLWGKFGQKVRDTTNFGNSGNELIEIATSQYRELTNVVALNDYDYYYQWRYKEKYRKPSEKTSVPIAVYTTAYGRLELYKYLEKLGERVLYCDTDSVFYVQPTNEEEIIKTGKFLGEMINELNRYGKGSYIREFVSSGPKFYSYIVVKPDKSEETVTKVGSVKLNSYNNDIFSHENMKKLAQGLLNSIEYESKETYPTEKHDVISRIVPKRVVKQSSKRFHADIDKSYPLGYKLSLLSIFKEYCFV